MAAINPYLNFNGNAEEAFNFYKSVFGGEFLTLMRYKDMPSDGSLSASEAEKIMHVALPIGQGTILMGGDTLEAMGKATIGTNISIAISPESKEDATRLFNGLAAGGQIAMPLDQAPWGALFGMLTDKFEIQWMVNYEKQ
jgi:PhnB protein